MVRVVGVRFKKVGKVYYFDPGDLPISIGTKVVVETARGVEYGEAAVGPKDVAADQVVQPLKKVLRIGTDRDAQTHIDNKRREKEAFSVAQKKILSHGLEMTLCDVEYTFDGSKNIFYFTAEGRVDFRELVRDLAGVFRTRIEMRQIGVRDEAKLLGGIGPCGRILCCTSFLGDFAPVSIRMAKDQNLSLNPSKISGLCGRLMCCLRYEQETYEAAKKDPTLSPGYMPPVNLPGAADLPELEEDDDAVRPAIGVRHSADSGVSVRIARAAGLVEEQRPAPKEGPRHQGGRPSGDGRPRGAGQPLQQGGGPHRPIQGPSPLNPIAGPTKGPTTPPAKPGQPLGPQPNRGTPHAQGQRAPGESQTEKPQGQHRHRRHRHRPKGGDKPQGDSKPRS